MDFVTVRELRSKMGEIWTRLSRDKELIVTSSGKPIAVLAGVTGSSVEDVVKAVRKAQLEWAVREARKSARERGLDRLSMRAIHEEVAKVRRSRKKVAH